MDIIVILFLFLSFVIGAIGTHLLKISDLSIKLFLSFSGSYLLSLSFILLLPEIFQSDSSEYIGLFVLLGFILQLIMDSISKGVEHGHHHDCDKEHGLHVSPIALMLGIGLHSFFEGMPFASEASGHHHELQNSLLTGIIIHNIPLSIVLMSLFLNAGYSVKKSYLFIIVIALAAPFGNLVSYLTGNHLVDNFEQYFQIILAMVVGIFFHISATILFESGNNHRMKLINWLIIILGISFALVSKLFH